MSSIELLADSRLNNLLAENGFFSIAVASFHPLGLLSNLLLRDNSRPISTIFDVVKLNNHHHQPELAHDHKKMLRLRTTSEFYENVPWDLLRIESLSRAIMWENLSNSRPLFIARVPWESRRIFLDILINLGSLALPPQKFSLATLLISHLV